jgi:hypothetical protein
MHDNQYDAPSIPALVAAYLVPLSFIFGGDFYIGRKQINLNYMTRKKKGIMEWTALSRLTSPLIFFILFYFWGDFYIGQKKSIQIIKT